jgi:hypothetical protein
MQSLTIQGFHASLNVTRAARCTGRKYRIKLSQVILAELQFDGLHVFFEINASLGARDRNNVIALFCIEIAHTHTAEADGRNCWTISA